MQKLKWIRLVPDKTAKGGIKSGFHSFQLASINDTRDVRGWHVYNGSWRKDIDTTGVSSAIGPTVDAPIISTYAIHAYVYPSLLDPTATQNVTYLGHVYNEASSVGMLYWDFNAGIYRERHSYPAVPATFLNIGGRCFAFDGAREGFIMDDRTPAIHVQNNQNLGIADPTQPLQIQSGGVTNYSAAGMIYAHMLSPFLNTPNPDSPIGTVLIADTVVPFILNPAYPYNQGALSGFWPTTPVVNAVTSNTVPTPFTATGTITATNGSSIITLAGANWPSLWRWCGLKITFAGKSYILRETYENTGGSNATWDLNGNAIILAAGEAQIWGVYDGPTISGISYVITGCQIQMSVGTPNATFAISHGPFDGYSQATNARIVKIGVAVAGKNMGNLGWAAGGEPRYAYAWYDPETGHISNLSPITQMPNVGVVSATSIRFPTDTGLLQYPQGAVSPIGFPVVGSEYERFSHIVFFRTLTGGGSTFFPIGSLQPYIAKVHPGGASTHGSWNPNWMGLPNDYAEIPPNSTPAYWYDFSTDADLLVTGGLIGPQYTNAKPIVQLAGGAQATGFPYAAVNWDQRLWLVNTQEPDKIMFSCDNVQCPFGIPEESFPQTNFLRIPSQDGRVIGMKLVGEMAVITTERFAYAIAGNNESNYRLVRISTRMPGVGTYQMDDFAGDVEGQPSVVYYLGRDRRVYRWYPGSDAQTISNEIQDRLNSILGTSLSNYTGSRLHCVSAWGRRFVVLSLNAQNGQTGGSFCFDVTTSIWTQNPIDNFLLVSAAINNPYAFTTVYGLDPPIREIAAVRNHLGGATLREWVRDDTATATANDSYITTFPMSFDGKKSKKHLFAVNLHTSIPGGWTLSVTTDESASKTYTSTFAPYGATPSTDALYSIYGPAVVQPVDYDSFLDSTAPANWRDIVILSAQFGTSDNSMPTGYRHSITLGQTAVGQPKGRLFAVDILYVDAADDGEVDP